VVRWFSLAGRADEIADLWEGVRILVEGGGIAS